MKAKWGRGDRGLSAPVALRAVFLLIDLAMKPVRRHDRLMYHWICEQGYGPIIIATKLDNQAQPGAESFG